MCLIVSELSSFVDVGEGTSKRGDCLGDRLSHQRLKIEMMKVQLKNKLSLDLVYCLGNDNKGGD